MIPMSERVFNRIPSFDERSRAFNVRAILDRTQPRSYTWGDLERLLSQDGEVCVPVVRQPFSNPTI